eukprot:1153210-Pelagomonas_calceolata.AAC.5
MVALMTTMSAWCSASSARLASRVGQHVLTRMSRARNTGAQPQGAAPHSMRAGVQSKEFSIALFPYPAANGKWLDASRRGRYGLDR